MEIRRIRFLSCYFSSWKSEHYRKYRKMYVQFNPFIIIEGEFAFRYCRFECRLSNSKARRFASPERPLLISLNCRLTFRFRQPRFNPHFFYFRPTNEKIRLSPQVVNVIRFMIYCVIDDPVNITYMFCEMR